MTNFLSSDYKTLLGFPTSQDWKVINHFKKYTELLTNIDDYFTTKIEALDSIASTDCSFNTTFWDGMKEDIKNLDLKNQIKNTSDKLLKCEDCLFSESNPRTHFEPAYGKQDGIFSKMIIALDTGSQSFLQNFMMAKQVSKYECSFMDIFKKVQELQTSIKDATIVNVFDQSYVNLRDAFENVKIYHLYHDYDKDDTQCTIKTNIAESYYNQFFIPDVGQSNNSTEKQKSFYDSIREYLSEIKEYLKDLNTLLDAMNGFYDMIYIGVKMIGALNITFYASPDEQEMLLNESETTFSAMTPVIYDENTSEQHSYTVQQNTIWAMNISVPIGVEASKWVDDNRTNQVTIFGSAVLSAFSAFGIHQRIQKLGELFATQHK